MFDHVQKAWGFYNIIYTDHNCRIKVLKVDPRKKISLHSHQRRDEQWTIVLGTAHFSVDGKDLVLKEGDRIFVPRNVKHKIENKSVYETLKVVEIQTGDSFMEEDIDRFDE